MGGAAALVEQGVALERAGRAEEPLAQLVPDEAPPGSVAMFPAAFLRAVRWGCPAGPAGARLPP